jgi:hypothetical protein
MRKESPYPGVPSWIAATPVSGMKGMNLEAEGLPSVGSGIIMKALL